MLKTVLALLLVIVLATSGCAPATSAPTQGGAPAAVAIDAGPIAESAAPAEAAAATTGAATAGKVIELTPNNTKIEFVGTKPDGKHNGGFKAFAGTMELAADGRTPSKITIEIETTSLWSDAEKLTNHLKRPDFFEVNAHPKSTFASTKIVPKQAGPATHELTGDLTLRGVTKSISIQAQITGGDELTLISDFTISRKEFGMTYGEGKVDDPVQITVAVKAPVK